MFGSQHPCGDLQPFVPPGSHAFLTFTDIRQKGGAQTHIQANTQTHTIKINKPFKEKCKKKSYQRDRVTTNHTCFSEYGNSPVNALQPELCWYHYI